MALESATSIPSNVPSSTGTFACFPKLPKEIQDQIWEEALPGARLVTIVLGQGNEFHPLFQSKPNIPMLRNSIRAACQPPVLLQVSNQSRSIAMKYYKPAFQQILRHPVFINYKIDILHFQKYHPLYVFDFVAQYTHSHKIEFPRVRNVAICHQHLTATSHHSLHCIMDVIKAWHKVEDIYMVSPVLDGPINGFLVEQIKEPLELHGGLMYMHMTDNEKEDWKAPNTWFLREADLRKMIQ